MLVVEAFGPDTIVVSGSRFGDVPAPLLGRRVDDPVRAHRADLEHVLAVGSASTRCGEWHGSNGPRSSAHSKVEPPIVEEKTNRAGPVTISASGPMSMVVSGASTIGEVPAGGRRVDVHRLVVRVDDHGAHAEDVVAEREAGGQVRVLALGELLAVDRALEGRRGCRWR